MADMVSMGELLIDFTPVGITEDGRLLFARNPGGAPANVAVQAHRAGVSAGFLGRVGKDMFGDFLVDTLERFAESLKQTGGRPAFLGICYLEGEELKLYPIEIYRDWGESL